MYSDQHRAVFKQYLADPRVLRRLDDDELTSLLEDRNFVDEVDRERARRSQPVPAPPTPTIPTKAGGVRTGLTKAAIGIIVKVFAPHLKDLIARCTTLEQRCDALEAKQSQPSASKSAGRWEGIHQQGRAYGEASLCTRSGSLWVSTRATAATPGSPDSGWQLIVKSGAYRDER